MITRLKLQNWKSHEDTELQFSAGTNVLIGVMGAGKSAVLDAVSFALFGTFPAVASKKTSLDNCVMNKPTQKNKAIVELFFEVQGKEYSILREITVGKGTTRSELRQGDELIEAPQTKRVTEEVVRVLGMDYDLFSRAVYSEQNQIDYFLQIPSGQRKKKIDELLRIDRFETGRKTASSIARQLKSESEGIGSQIGTTKPPDTEKEQKALGELKKQSSVVGQQLAEAREGLSRAEQKTAELEKQEKEIGELRKKISAAESKAEVYAASQKEIGGELEKARGKDVAKELENVKAKAGEVTKEIKLGEDSGVKKQKADAEKALALAEDKVKQLSERLQEKEKLVKEITSLKPLRQKLAGAREEKECLLSRKKELEIAVSESIERREALDKAGDHCPVCDSAIPDKKRQELGEKARKKKETSEKELAKIQEKLDALGINALEEGVSQLESMEARLGALQVDEALAGAEQRLEKVKEEFAEVEEKALGEDKKLASLRREKDGLESEMKELEFLSKSAEKLEGIKKELERLGKETAEFKMRLKETKFDEKGLEKSRQKTKELSAKAGRLEAEEKSMRQLIEEKKKLLAEMGEREREIISLKARGESLKQASESMSVFKSALEETQAQLREHFVTGVNDALAIIWKQVYPYQDYPGLRLGVESGDYTLQVKTLGDEWVNIEWFASGGEKSTAALALRIAFSMVLAPQLSWLVLDEPTHNLDSKGVAKLSATLRDELPELVGQVFVITHDEEMEAAVSGNLYRLEREKGEDQPTTAVLVASGKD